VKGASVAIAIAGVSIASLASADDRAACARSYEQAQRHRQAHELKAARSELLVCSRKECPAWVRRDCVPWLGEIDAALPSLVVTLKSEGSKSDARVTVDGAAASPDASIALDPGEHVVVVERAGAARIEQRVTLREGEGERRIEITLTPETPHHDDVPAPAPAPERPVPVLVYVLGGAGLVAGGLGTYFQISGMSKRSDLFACAPSCASADVDSARRTLWAGNILLGTAVIALAGAAVLYFTRPTSDRAALALGYARF
jgi:hypothetical protein